MSQLAVASLSGTTPRHLSFVETGRSRPGRELVLRLAEALDVPLGDRNALFVAAGLPPEYASARLDDASMRPLRDVVARVLLGHEPYPAWVFGRGLTVIDSNRGADRLFPGLRGMAPEAIVDLWFGPGPFREAVENWHDVVAAGVTALRREAVRTGDPAVVDLAKRAEAHLARVGGVPASRAELPVVCARFRFGDRTVRTISSVMRFDAAIDATAAELRVELMFPADAESEAFFRA